MNTRQRDSLRELFLGTAAFYERFGYVPQLADSVTNFREETRELIEAAEINSDVAHIAEEAADVFVTAMGVCMSCGVDIDLLIDQVYAVIDKNNAKTHETHIYTDGKIRRRSSLK
ncbi:MAG: hypothetical protein KC547_18005 [Anaerolineae bacterium]|nr:hypothetical protein [Anaerolineae bacterium]MCA9909162.1 hypothetical protein [Anaerolineae bacterium]